MGLLDHIIVLFVIPRGTSVLFSVVAALVYIVNLNIYTQLVAVTLMACDKSMRDA